MSLYFVYTTGNSGVISPVLLLYRKLVVTARVHTICSIQYQEYFIPSNAAGNAERYSILCYLHANFRGGRVAGKAISQKLRHIYRLLHRKCSLLADILWGCHAFRLYFGEERLHEEPNECLLGGL